MRFREAPDPLGSTCERERALGTGGSRMTTPHIRPAL
jgi:hypothetical protein